MGIKQQWKLYNNNKRTHDVFIRKSNKWKLNNNMKKKRHNVFIRESNNSGN